MTGRYWKTTVVLPPAIYLLAFRAHHFILSNSLLDPFQVLLDKGGEAEPLLVVLTPPQVEHADNSADVGSARLSTVHNVKDCTKVESV